MPWINTRAPQLGIMVARGQYDKLDSLFRRLFMITLGISILLSTSLWVLAYWLDLTELPIKARILPLLPFTLFLLAWIIQTAVASLAVYLRAHKREPMMIPSIVGAVLVGCSTWLFGRSFGPLGAAAGFLAIAVIFGLPSCLYIFIRSRRDWHTRSPVDVL
jgi:O-antigen/teichoic acid export membrane protein